MGLEGPARSRSLAWSNPLARWLGLLTLVSGANIAVWFLLYHQLPEQPTGSLGSTSSIGLMLLLCAAYVFGCAFRSCLPRADVQRICLFDTWLSSVVVDFMHRSKEDYYSTTWSARASSCAGTLMPIAFAVLRLIASSNLIGSSTGSSSGLAPLRILSMYAAERRKMA